MKHLPINWTDGVKLSEKHFFENHYNTIETIKSYNVITQKKYDYGILNRFDGNTEALKIDLLNDSGDELVIRLSLCNAIAEDGYRIMYNEGLYGNDHMPTKMINTSNFDKNTNQVFYVTLVVNPFESVPVGVPDPEVIPLHHPYALPKISIDILPEGKTNTSYIKESFLVIGKVILSNGKFSLDNEYIPPVRKIDYNIKLKTFRESLVQMLLRVKNNAIQIFRKNKKNSSANKLVENTFILCNNINDFYSQNIFYLEGIIGEQPPIHFVEKISILANYFSVSLGIMDEKEREMMLQYYYEWTDIKPSNFLNTIGEVLSIQYNHIEILETVNKLNKFMGIVDRLFQKMSDLEYIGQRKDNIVISEDSSLRREKVGDSTWSIID
ncbi:hypothetical protein [Tenacibaculum maritimum]|uniref:hypothetical protein n=1 Tax=Tenacibaculum maritimum TaxID=107401 RepID=UPI0038904F5E